jgi:hypothetical protein
MLLDRSKYFLASKGICGTVIPCLFKAELNDSSVVAKGLLDDIEGLKFESYVKLDWARVFGDGEVLLRDVYAISWEKRKWMTVCMRVASSESFLRVFSVRVHGKDFVLQLLFLRVIFTIAKTFLYIYRHAYDPCLQNAISSKVVPLRCRPSLHLGCCWNAAVTNCKSRMQQAEEYVWKHPRIKKQLRKQAQSQ